MDDKEFDDFARCMGMKAVLLLIQTNGVVFPTRNSRTKKRAEDAPTSLRSPYTNWKPSLI